ncbi:MAG: formylglycine-generating enzyme family protein [Deltaproteobacteria bacterium]|jgi:hypothetical protein|nr:formylglycine-generating enzyme family protein [Deltaproteobacteria bacterium]
MARLLTLAGGALFGAFLLCGSALWAQVGGRDRGGAESAWNPHPDPQDYLLPLPCEMKMAFRPVFIPEEGRLGETRGFFGVNVEDQGTETRGYLNRKRLARLGSALSLDNLPDSYLLVARGILRRVLNAASDGHQLYFIGKYEVTRGQWRALMDGDCESAGDSALPQTDVSWYDAQRFAERLMAYVLENAPDELPSYREDPLSVGIVRLPTEEEWEYAARGGHAVGEEAMNAEDFFPMGGKLPSAHGLFNDGIAPPPERPQAVGRREPNPLGVYDTIGNAAEMTQETFRMNFGNRLHGSYGGMVAKGGSFRVREGQTMPGAREEIPFFYKTGPARLDDLGFRLAVSAVNLGSAARLRDLSGEYDSALRGNAAPVEGERDPLEILQELIRNAETEREKAAYESLRTEVENFNDAVDAEKKSQANRQIWNLVYQALGVRANSVRIVVERNYIDFKKLQIEAINGKLKQKAYDKTEEKAARAYVQSREAENVKSESLIGAIERSFEGQRGAYITLLRELDRDFSPETIALELKNLETRLAPQQFARVGTYAKVVWECFAVVKKHVDFVVVQKKNPSLIPLDDLRSGNS